ncbi:MAG: aspartate/glutamate racemase family protein [Pseudohongiellaceae bacterium]
MQTIGLLGGMSWQSSATYYRLINEGVSERLGGLHSARLCLVSVDFQPIERLQHAGDWSEMARRLGAAANGVARGGADFMLLCTNTMHKVADDIAAAIPIPLLHIGDATGSALQADGRIRVGLLGTRFTMEEDFYRHRLQHNFDIEVLIPAPATRGEVHRVIYEELCLGNIQERSRQRYLAAIDELADAGAQAIILGCTEIAMLIDQGMTNIPLYDTTLLHCQAAVQRALPGHEGG